MIFSRSIQAFPVDDSSIYIDAGYEFLRVFRRESGFVCSNHQGHLETALRILFPGYNVNKSDVFITGNLAEQIRHLWGQGVVLSTEAVLSSFAQSFFDDRQKDIRSLAVIEISASGHRVLVLSRINGIEHIRSHPKCGGGTGFNLDRILGKLNIRREDVDHVLRAYLGPEGEATRKALSVRADRCGVFASSATVSDKNVGVPLDHALGVTIKSETYKVAQKVSGSPDTVLCCGGIFRWRFARDCIRDFFRRDASVTPEILFDEDHTFVLRGMIRLVDRIPRRAQRTRHAKTSIFREKLPELPPFQHIKSDLKSKHLYINCPPFPVSSQNMSREDGMDMALDVGSTMAKMMLKRSGSDLIIFQSALHNHGDTAETIKELFRHCQDSLGDAIRLRSIGVTGSARYQVRKLLDMTYPELTGRVFTETENDAHAAGSVRFAGEWIEKDEIPAECRDRFVVIDVGGEDTKISVADPESGMLIDNAMNIKCSAGTGSLMDTLVALFKYENIEQAHGAAMKAAKAYCIDATCAVFLMEHARRMQASGIPLNEILASCSHAIAENMARSLWPLVNIPKGALVLLHGQTMLSEPLPLAIAHRIQEYTSVPTPCIVPPLPGHRACLGLLTLSSRRFTKASNVQIKLSSFRNLHIERHLFTCRGVACGDIHAACARVRLTCRNGDKKTHVLLGGCTAVNELESRRKISGEKAEDGTKTIHDLYYSLPPSVSTNAIITIPCSFSVGEWGIFLAFALHHLGINTRIDPVIGEDVLRGQQFFNVDTCAPHAGAAGQLTRLAGDQIRNRDGDGWILFPVIDTLPFGTGYARTCTSNQGGVFTALHFARSRYPQSRILTIDLPMKDMDTSLISGRLYQCLAGPLRLEEKNITMKDIEQAVEKGWKDLLDARRKMQDKAVALLQEAWKKNHSVAVICGRQYILDPGIFDSYAGKLLSEKGMYTLPSYIIDTSIADSFKMVYWSNPQRILSILAALRDRRLHEIVLFKPLAEALKPFESGANDHPRLRPCLVSTFRCGPDSIIQPIIFEMFKNEPILVLQSDGMIKELAHLETRTATLVDLWHRNECTAQKDSNEAFSMEKLSRFSCAGVNHETDVVYVPTMGDNRLLCAALRSWNLVVRDNYQPHRYRLSERIMKGRMVVGDAVCGPFAGVFADIEDAWEDFKRVRQDVSSACYGKRRAAVLSPTGTGPCRQGMYVTTHRVFFYRFNRDTGGAESNGVCPEFCLWTAEDTDVYRMNLPEWLHIRGLQALILNDMLRSLAYAAMGNVSNEAELRRCMDDMENLKRKLIKRFESSGLSKTGRFISRWGSVGKYFGYGIWNSLGILSWIRDFSMKYNVSPEPDPNRLRIHVDGEVYMRISSGDELFFLIHDMLGFRTFHFDITPIWTYIEYLLTDKDTSDTENKQSALLELLRYRIARPLYSAANIPMPLKVSDLLRQAAAIIHHLKPEGELAPYLGEAIHKGQEGIHLFLNVAPESCMVSTMGDALTKAVMKQVARKDFLIVGLFSQNGDFDKHLLENAFLRLMGPERFYSIG